MKTYSVITKEHIITEKELKDKLGLTGRITTIQLWKGLCPNDEALNKSDKANKIDKIEWCIETEEKG